MRVAYLNRRFVPLGKAKVSFLDRGFLYGDGAFETMRSYDGAVFRPEKHIRRMEKALKTLNIDFEISESKIQRIIYKLLKANKLKNAYIKIIVTRGSSPGLLIPEQKRKPTFIVYARPYKAPPRSVYEKGIRVAVSKKGASSHSAISTNKTLNYLHSILHSYAARKKGFDDVIVVTKEGFASEASSSNVFFVKGNEIITPSLKSGILPGITREEVITLAKRLLKKQVKEKSVKENAIYKADEIFLTNSLKEIVPVTKVGSRIVGSGMPGPLTRVLMRLYRESVSS